MGMHAAAPTQLAQAPISLSSMTIAALGLSAAGAKTAEARAMPSTSALLLAATSVSTLTARRTSDTLMVPNAEDFRPAKGKLSGPRWHWALMFTLQVVRAQTSKILA